MLQNAYCLFHRKRIYRVGTIIEACIFSTMSITCYRVVFCRHTTVCQDRLLLTIHHRHHHQNLRSYYSHHLIPLSKTWHKNITLHVAITSMLIWMFFLLTHRYPIVCSCGSCSFLVCWEYQSRTTINNQLLLTPIPYENLGKLCQTCHIAILNSRICFS